MKNITKTKSKIETKIVIPVLLGGLAIFSLFTFMIINQTRSFYNITTNASQNTNKILTNGGLVNTNSNGNGCCAFGCAKPLTQGVNLGGFYCLNLAQRDCSNSSEYVVTKCQNEDLEYKPDSGNARWYSNKKCGTSQTYYPDGSPAGVQEACL